MGEELQWRSHPVASTGISQVFAVAAVQTRDPDWQGHRRSRRVCSWASVDEVLQAFDLCLIQSYAVCYRSDDANASCTILVVVSVFDK